MTTTAEGRSVITAWCIATLIVISGCSFGVTVSQKPSRYDEPSGEPPRVIEKELRRRPFDFNARVEGEQLLVDLSQQGLCAKFNATPIQRYDVTNREMSSTWPLVTDYVLGALLAVGTAYYLAPEPGETASERKSYNGWAAGLGAWSLLHLGAASYKTISAIDSSTAGITFDREERQRGDPFDCNPDYFPGKTVKASVQATIGTREYARATFTGSLDPKGHAIIPLPIEQLAADHRNTKIVVEAEISKGKEPVKVVADLRDSPAFVAEVLKQQSEAIRARIQVRDFSVVNDCAGILVRYPAMKDGCAKVEQLASKWRQEDDERRRQEEARVVAEVEASATKLAAVYQPLLGIAGYCEDGLVRAVSNRKVIPLVDEAIAGQNAILSVIGKDLHWRIRERTAAILQKDPVCFGSLELEGDSIRRTADFVDDAKALVTILEECGKGTTLSPASTKRLAPFFEKYGDEDLAIDVRWAVAAVQNSALAAKEKNRLGEAVRKCQERINVETERKAQAQSQAREAARQVACMANPSLCPTGQTRQRPTADTSECDQDERRCLRQLCQHLFGLEQGECVNNCQRRRLRCIQASGGDVNGAIRGEGDRLAYCRDQNSSCNDFCDGEAESREELVTCRQKCLEQLNQCRQ